MSKGKKLLAAGLVLALLILLNVIAALIPWKIDFTEDRLYSLSPGSKRILDAIDEPIEVEFFFSGSAEGLPVFLRTYADRVREMLRQYAAHSRGRLTVKVTDPKPDTPDEERALRLGIDGQQLPGRADRLFLGIVARQADSTSTIPFLNLERERFLEYDLSQLIFSVQQLDRPKLGLLTSLPLKGSPGAPWIGQAPQPPQLLVKELERTFEIVAIDTGANELPPDLAALAVIHPPRLSAQLEFAIDQFALGGKPVFIAVDPMSRFMSGQSSPMMGPNPARSSNLARIFAAYGIAYDADSVVGDLALATSIPGSAGAPFSYPLLPTFLSENMDQDSPLTSQLQRVMFIESGSVDLAPNSSLTKQPLIRTSERAGVVPSVSVGLISPEETTRTLVVDGVQRTVAAFFRGEVSSAFPQGRPPAEGETESPAPVTAPLEKGRVNLFVVADTDWLMDAFSVRRAEFLGTQSFIPLNDNLGLAANILESFAGSADLASLRGRGTALRPFRVIDDLEREAQRLYQSRLDDLDAQLRRIEGQINEILSRQSEQRMLAATPELQASLAQFREQQAQIRAERREIRRALREEIEGLKTRIILMNLTVVPALVAIGGAVFFAARRSRRLEVSKHQTHTSA